MAGFIGLEDAKAHLVAVPDDDATLVQSLVDAAAAHIERRTGYVAASRADEAFSFDRFGRQLELRLRPVDPESIAVSYLDGDGTEQVFTDIRVVEINGTTRILPAIGHSWPTPVCAPGAVTVTATVGYAATDADGAPAAPDTLKHATRLLIGSWYQDRESGPVPETVALLLDDERAKRA